ncbi:hypothetical protein HUT16_00415 [Kitasatospora sp. NA04385]|uniref:hypothetical protein n=1 Tax=Kitasatospora sp. NA04385 TaxID=2742135 RepID=UPI001590D5AB|nr:hypothetical protein [Kitasatospora sp. NA04385]QKW17725.1 hypothetical protein HUT16_00415 [Kitasatospora sp. NA04385]
MSCFSTAPAAGTASAAPSPGAPTPSARPPQVWGPPWIVTLRTALGDGRTGLRVSAHWTPTAAEAVAAAGRQAALAGAPGTGERPEVRRWEPGGLLRSPAATR